MCGSSNKYQFNERRINAREKIFEKYSRLLCAQSLNFWTYNGNANYFCLIKMFSFFGWFVRLLFFWYILSNWSWWPLVVVLVSSHANCSIRWHNRTLIVLAPLSTQMITISLAKLNDDHWHRRNCQSMSFWEIFFFWINATYYESTHIAEHSCKRLSLFEINILRKAFNVSNYRGFWDLHTLIVDSWITFFNNFILCRPFTGDLKVPCNQQLRKFSWNEQKKLNFQQKKPSCQRNVNGAFVSFC